MQQFNYPLFVIHTDNVEEIDGILWIEDQVLDDKNMSGKTLGIRRLQTPMKSIYPLRYMIEDEISLMKHRGKSFIDNTGEVIYYEKQETVSLTYYKIKKVEKKGVAALIWLKGIPYPFAANRPPEEGYTWVGMIHKSGLPWKIWEFAEAKKRDTWRKC